MLHCVVQHPLEYGGQPLLCSQGSLVHHLLQHFSLQSLQLSFAHIGSALAALGSYPACCALQQVTAPEGSASAVQRNNKCASGHGFRTCSALNCSALLCRAVTTDDEDVAKQAIEVWNTIAEEEIDRQQVSQSGFTQ